MNFVKEITATELKRLLVTISETRSAIRFRYRMVGEMWYQNFVRVLKVTERGIILNDEIRNRLYSLPDISTIIQFELDGSIYGFQPHFHYDVSGKMVL